MPHDVGVVSPDSSFNSMDSSAWNSAIRDIGGAPATFDNELSMGESVDSDHLNDSRGGGFKKKFKRAFKSLRRKSRGRGYSGTSVNSGGGGGDSRPVTPISPSSDFERTDSGGSKSGLGQFIDIPARRALYFLKRATDKQVG